MSEVMNRIPDPEYALMKFKQCVEDDLGLLGRDGKPIHWMVKDTETGLLFCDSAYLLATCSFSGIQVKVSSNQIMMTPEQMEPILEKFLDWMAANIPQTKEWAVEFKQGCPIIPTNREVIE